MRSHDEFIEEATPMTVTLTMTAAQRKQLHSHLFPGDGCEAVAILLCARRAGERVHRLLVREDRAGAVCRLPDPKAGPGAVVNRFAAADPRGSQS